MFLTPVQRYGLNVFVYSIKLMKMLKSNPSAIDLTQKIYKRRIYRDFTQSSISFITVCITKNIQSKPGDTDKHSR